MSDPSSPTIGEIVDSSTTQVANDAAAIAAAQTAQSLPETTVVVEDNPTTTDPALALEYADDIRKIAREEANNNMLAWIELASSQQPPEPQVVIVEKEPEIPAPIEQPTPPKPVRDQAPPTSHPYFKPLRKPKTKDGT